jgi:histidine ammonia-lyase
MGMTAATKLRTSVLNAEHIIAIEMLAAAEGLDYRAPLQPGKGVRRAYSAVRALAPRLTRDRSLAPDIQKVADALCQGDFDF